LLVGKGTPFSGTPNEPPSKRRLVAAEPAAATIAAAPPPVDDIGAGASTAGHPLALAAPMSPLTVPPGEHCKAIRKMLSDAM
jgi:hypothetical protein